MSIPGNDDGLKLLDSAYALNSPSDSAAYYDVMATNYDADFAEGMGYITPKTIAEVYLGQCKDEDSPIADIGCGTGLVAEALQANNVVIDGLDISQKMLDASASKQLYRSLHALDLTGPLDHLPHDYGAVLSAGTFTHGHLGPEVLENLLQIARADALFVIAVNLRHFKQLKFDQLLADLENQQRISRTDTIDVSIYAKSDHSHANDQARVLSYRKLG